MAKLPGLFQRAGVYQHRVIIPLDLQPAYSGKSKMVRSLGTTDRREAELRYAHARSGLLEEFKEKRRSMQPQRLESVTPDMAAELAQRVRARALRQDDEARDSPKFRDALQELHRLTNPLEKLKIRSTQQPPTAATFAPLDSLAGLAPEEADVLAHLNARVDGEAALSMARRNLAAVLPMVQQEAQALGLEFDSSAPGARAALDGALKAYRQARHEITQRDTGEIVHTPVFQSMGKVHAKPAHLRDVYARWKASKPRSQDSLNAALRSVALFEEYTSNPALAQLTREQGDGFRTWLQQPERKTTSKTAHDRLTWVKSLLKYAARDLEVIPKNPWEGLEIAHKTTNKRRPWTDAELIKMFSQPLYTAYKLPKAKRAGADAAYWIPLLGLYTGARIGELAQLKVSDVESVKGISVLAITDAGEGQTVKTEAGIRKVPIHSELVRLGLLEYVHAMHMRGESQLWPTLPTRTGKPGDLFGRWFREYRKALGFGKYPDFHSLRHTVRTQMAEAEISEQQIDAIIGHEIKGSTGARVYTHRTLTAMQRAIGVLSYPALELPRCSPTNPAQ